MCARPVGPSTWPAWSTTSTGTAATRSARPPTNAQPPGASTRPRELGARRRDPSRRGPNHRRAPQTDRRPAMAVSEKAAVTGGAGHHMRTDSVTSRPKRVLIVVANPDLDGYDAVMIAGGQAPMFSYRNDTGLHETIRVAGKTVTGFSDSEEDYSDQAAGVRLMPWRLEPLLRERGANRISAGLFKAF